MNHSPNRSCSFAEFRYLAVAVAVLLLAVAPASAGFILTLNVQSTTATAGSTSNDLEITLTNSGSSAVTIAGFSFGIQSSSSNITFTDAQINTTLPYVFAGNSLFGPDITTSVGNSLFGPDIAPSAPGLSLTASDFAAVGGTSLGSGETVGLAHVSFNVAAGTPNGPVTVSFLSYPTTSLSDDQDNNLSFNAPDGTITVSGSGSAVVPEPSSLLLAITALSPAAWWVLRRGRRAGVEVCG